MLKRFSAIVIIITIIAGMITIPAIATDTEAEYITYWSSDFDTGTVYLETDTQIKDFDTYNSANTYNSSKELITPPDFWDGTYQYYTWYDTDNYDYNAKVVRRVDEDNNGMMSFQHTGTGKTYGIFVEKTLGEVDPLIPELIVEYKIRFTQTAGSSWYIRQHKAASASTATRLQGPVFQRSTGKIHDYDSDNTDNMTFEYGTAANPSSKWYTVRIVYSNSENTRTTYIDGVLAGKSDNTTYATYFKDGKATLRLEGIMLSGDTIIDIDDIKVMAEKKVSSKTPTLIQNGAEVSEYEYSDDPVSASAEIINLKDSDAQVTVYVAAYENIDGKMALKSYDVKTDTIPSGTKQKITTNGIELPLGVSELKAFVWEHLTPLTASKDFEKAVFESSADGMPDFGNLSEIGSVSFSKKVGAASTGYTVDGLRTFMALVGTPGYVYEFDTYTGQILNSFESGNGLQHCIKVGSDKKVYTMPMSTCQLFAYDPETKVNTLIEDVTCDGSYAWHMNYGAVSDTDHKSDTSMLYMPVYNSEYVTEGSSVIEYDIDNNKVSVYKGFDIGCKYAHCATGDENYIYVGSADSTEVATISRMDKKTGKIVTYEDDKGRTPGYIKFIKVIGDLIFTRINKSIVVLNKDTMEKINEFKGGRGQYDCVSDPDPSNSDLVYFSSNDGLYLYYYNMKDNTYGILFSTSDYFGSYVEFDFGRWFPDEDGVVGISAVGGKSEAPGIFHIAPDGTTEFRHRYSYLKYESFGVPVKPSYFYVSRDDILYTGGYEAGLNGFDLKTNKRLFSVQNGNQHGMTMVNGMLFGGSYGEDGIYMFDTSKSKSSSNPIKVASTEGVCRYYNTSDTNAGFGLSVGIADYGGEEGGVILMTYYDSTPYVKQYNGIVPNQNIIGVAYRDGYIYASSSVNVPQHEFEEQAYVVKVDATTGNVINKVSVNFSDDNNLPNTTAIGEIRFGPDGLLYGKANAGETIFALDPDDLSLVKYKSYFPNETNSAGLIGTTMIFGSEGNLYTNLSGDLYCINIETMDAKKINSSQSYFCLDNDGNILRRYGENSLAKVIVNQRQRLEIMIENAEKYYKEEDYSEESWAVFENALSEAKAIDIEEAYLSDVREAARKLGFAIKDLQTLYDYNAGFAFPFK